MIKDHISQIHRYNIKQEAFNTLVSYIAGYNKEEFKTGKFEIDGNVLWGIGLEYETKEPDKCLWEAHRKYIDFHWIIEGQEFVEISDIQNTINTKEYDSEGDYALFEAQGARLPLLQNEFLMLYPNEVHKTSIINSIPVNIKKIVFKILIEH